MQNAESSIIYLQDTNLSSLDSQVNFFIAHSRPELNSLKSYLINTTFHRFKRDLHRKKRKIKKQKQYAFDYEPIHNDTVDNLESIDLTHTSAW